MSETEADRPPAPRRASQPTTALLLPVADRPTRRLTTTMIAALVFLGAMASLATTMVGLIGWQASREVSRSLTVELPATTAASEVEAVAEALAALDGVGTARPLGSGETRALLEPWLGTDRLEGILLPRLIAVTTIASAAVPVGSIERTATALLPSAIVIDHRRMAGNASDAVEAVLAVGVAVLAALLLALALGARALTRAAVAGQGDTIEVLQVLGTPDDLIARAFSRRMRRAALNGAALAVLLVVVTATTIVAVFGGGAVPRVTPVLAAGAAAAILVPAVLAVLLCGTQASRSARRALLGLEIDPGFVRAAGRPTSPAT